MAKTKLKNFVILFAHPEIDAEDSQIILVKAEDADGAFDKALELRGSDMSDLDDIENAYDDLEQGTFVIKEAKKGFNGEFLSGGDQYGTEGLQPFYIQWIMDNNYKDDDDGSFEKNQAYLATLDLEELRELARNW